MIAENNDKKTDFKKVCSETSFLRCNTKNSSKEAQKRSVPSTLMNQKFSVKVLNKKCSKSMNDLSHQVYWEPQRTKENDEVFTSCYKSIGLLKKTIISENITDKFARRCILNLLMLNAWRKQKMNYKQTVEKITSLNEKLEGFEMQVYLLRQLLNAEKNRIKTANQNVHELLHKLEENNKDRTEMIKKNEELENNVKLLLEYCSQIDNVLRNQENDIITSKLEAENWEKQLEKEREKLKKLENEEITLKKKIQFNEKVIMEKTQQLEQLTESNRELQQKLAFQVPLWDETMAQVDLASAKLEESEVVKKELEKALEEKDKEIKKLTSSIEALEKKLQEENEKNEVLRTLISEKTSELDYIEKKFNDVSKSRYQWSGSIVKMASLCAKIPVACICTVGSLLLPFPSYKI